MKKLYAKTTFATKKSQKQAKLTAVELDNDSNEKNVLHKSYPSPIMAYRNSANSETYGGAFIGDTATINKTPKMMRAFKKDTNELSLPPRTISPQNSLCSLPTTPATTNYYYSITEVEQRARQQEWRRRRLTQTPVLSAPFMPYHQNQNMPANDVAKKPITPIYDQPQIMTAINQIPAITTVNGGIRNNNNNNNNNNFVVITAASANNYKNNNKGGVGVDVCDGDGVGVGVGVGGSFNSLQQHNNHLWNCQQQKENDSHNHNNISINSNSNNNNNNNNEKNDDKRLTTVTTKMPLHHSQSLPTIRTINGNTIATMSAAANNNNLNYYQHNDDDQQQQQPQSKLDYQQQEYKLKLQNYNSLPLERHNSVKENYTIGGFANYAAAALNM